MNEETKAQLAPYMKENGYYNTLRIRTELEGKREIDARFDDIFGDSDPDAQPEVKSELLIAAEEYNAAKMAEESQEAEQFNSDLHDAEQKMREQKAEVEKAASVTEKQIELINSLWTKMGERNWDELGQPLVAWFYAHADFHHLTKEQASKWINVLKNNHSFGGVMDDVMTGDLYGYLGSIGKTLKIAVDILEKEIEPADEKRQERVLQEAHNRVTRAAVERLATRNKR